MEAHRKFERMLKLSDDIVYLTIYDESWPELAAKEMKAIRVELIRIVCHLHNTLPRINVNFFEDKVVFATKQNNRINLICRKFFLE